jgi:hypothetical protein
MRLVVEAARLTPRLLGCRNIDSPLSGFVYISLKNTSVLLDIFRWTPIHTSLAGTRLI